MARARTHRDRAGRSLARAATGTALLLLAVAGTVPAAPAGVEAPAHRIACFPIENLTGHAQSVADLEDGIVRRLGSAGVEVLDRGTLEGFLARYRLRWTGGITTRSAAALAEETGARDVLLTSLDLDQENPPRIGFTMRLTRFEADGVRVVWARTVARTGLDAPGLLDLGVISDLPRLSARAFDDACADLASFLGGAERPEFQAPPRRFRPRVYHAVPGLTTGEGRVAVLPFANDTARRFAGEVLANRLVCALVESGATVIEPGEVRQTLIDARLIQQGGIDYAQAELLRDLAGADLVVTGRVFQFADPLDADGLPVVEFTTTGIDARQRQVGWVAFSRARGASSLRFFDRGTIRSAAGLADALVRGLAVQAARAESAPDEPTKAPGRSSIMSRPGKGIPEGDR